MTENTLPQELKEFAEKEAEKHFPKIPIELCTGPIDFDVRNSANRFNRKRLREFATALYAHLKPLIDAKEKIIESQNYGLIELSKEIDRQRTEIKSFKTLLDAKDEEIKRNSISFATFITDNQYEFSKKDCQWYRSTLDYDVKDEDELWQEFKTQNNL